MRLGIDTGGTFTDAAVLRGDGSVFVSAKAPTTHRDLIVGVSTAVDRVLTAMEAAGSARSQISSVALSTTLATNAMVEHTGGGAALVVAGFDPGAVERIDGLASAAHVIAISGGHNAQGREIDELGTDALVAEIDSLAKTEAIAVASLFAVRNDAHERAVRSLLARDPKTAHIPVTCSHELSGRLDGPRRAATALANAVLTAPVRRLIDAFERSVREAGVDAPLVVVRSDGSVMSLGHAMERPVETILSGPAASLVGGIHLAGVQDAIIVDIGGTTTDVAVVSNGIPEIVDDGATVGGVGTMIRSPRIRTEGLGGDSEVGWDEHRGVLKVGPGRVIPLGAAQVRFPQLNDLLQAQASRRIVSETDGLFCVTPDGELLEATTAFSTRREYLAARRRASAGELQFVALTPTDAAWAAGLVDRDSFGSAFDQVASKSGLELFAATLGRFGVPRFESGQDAARSILAEVQHRTGSVIASAVGVPSTVWTETLRSQELYRVGVQLDRPIIGIGASAALHHPPLASLLGTDVHIPEWSEVANAIGAAVGSVRMQLTASITSPKRAGFVVHRPGVTTSFETLDEAVEEATDRLIAQLNARHRSSGLEVREEEVQISIERHDNSVHIDGADFFVECLLEGTLTHAVGN